VAGMAGDTPRMINAIVTNANINIFFIILLVNWIIQSGYKLIWLPLAEQPYG
jgi:hypothetical protein